MKIAASPQAITLPGDIVAAKGAFFSWPASIYAKSYQFSYSLQADFTAETIESTPFNGLHLFRLARGNEYWVRVRSVNSFGVSTWSNAVKIRIDEGQLDVPVLLSPGLNARLTTWQPYTMTFSSVPAATGYQIQISITNDANFVYPVNEFVEGTSFFFYPHKSAYQWRVRAIQNDKYGKWSEVSYFSGNTKRNPDIGLFLPISLDNQDVPCTFPFAYQPTSLAPAVRITVADNPDFLDPLFLNNYESQGIITDIIKDLPLNTELYFRVQERDLEHVAYPTHYLIDDVIRFYTGTKTKPATLTFMSELDQNIFGYPNPKIAVSGNHIWWPQKDHGFIKMDQRSLNYEIFNRSNTNGLVGVWLEKSVETDENNTYVLSRGNYDSYRLVKLDDEVPASDAETDIFYLYNYILDFNPEKEIYWTHREIYKKSGSGVNVLKQFPDYQQIKQVRIYDNKAWILLVNYSPHYYSEIVIMDLDHPELTERIDYTTNSNIYDIIEQIEIQSDGKVWLRQRNQSSEHYAVAYSEGSGWILTNGNNFPSGSQIQSLSLSPSNEVYLMVSGSETQIYKYSDGSWEKAGDALPYRNFTGELRVDGHENFWIASVYGLARMASPSSLPVSLVSFDANQERNSVVFHWEVSDETNIRKYVVEHSGNGKLFHPVTETLAAHRPSYTGVHADPVRGINYYRLKSVEHDNSFSYSKIISVNFSDDEETIFFPNPARKELNIRVKPGLVNKPGRIIVITADGKEVLSTVSDRFGDTQSIDFSNIPSGTYIIRVEGEKEASSQKVQVVR